MTGSLCPSGLKTPLTMACPRQECWPFPSPGDLPNPGTDPTSPALADRFFTTKPPGKPLNSDTYSKKKTQNISRPCENYRNKRCVEGAARIAGWSLIQSVKFRRIPSGGSVWRCVRRMNGVGGQKGRKNYLCRLTSSSERRQWKERLSGEQVCGSSGLFH